MHSNHYGGQKYTTGLSMEAIADQLMAEKELRHPVSGRVKVAEHLLFTLMSPSLRAERKLSGRPCEW